MTWGRTFAVTVGLLVALQGTSVFGQQQPADVENPLEKILELMEKVEDRLYEAGDTGKYTQQEQKKIVEALRFEDKTRQAIEDLIEHIENQPP